jgi:hypothetical protein
MRGSNSKRFGSPPSILALTQCVFRAPKVSTRVKFARTPPLGPLSGLSTLKYVQWFLRERLALECSR